MAKAVINLQKESGGIVKISPVDGTGVTELVVPESGNLVSVGTSVTDNAIARYDGTTGKVQNSGVIIDDIGNIGVGVTPSAWRNTHKSIDIGAIGSIVSDSGSISIASNSYLNTSSNMVYKQSGIPAMLTEQYNGATTWYTAPSGTAGNPITWTNTMTLDSSGYLYFGVDTAGTTTTGMRRGSSGQLILRASNVGLYHQAGTSYYLITTAGGSTSDITLKKDIEVIPNSLNKILNLKGVYYEFIEEQLCTADKGKQIGVIAQNVEQEFPEIVLTNEDGIKTVRYDRLIAPMIEAIKEQQEIINDLKVRVEKLELGAK